MLQDFFFTFFSNFFLLITLYWIFFLFFNCHLLFTSYFAQFVNNILFLGIDINNCYIVIQKKTFLFTDITMKIKLIFKSACSDLHKNIFKLMFISSSLSYNQKQFNEILSPYLSYVVEVLIYIRRYICYLIVMSLYLLFCQ